MKLIHPFLLLHLFEYISKGNWFLTEHNASFDYMNQPRLHGKGFGGDCCILCARCILHLSLTC